MVSESTNFGLSEDSTFSLPDNSAGTPTSGDYVEIHDQHMETPYPAPAQPPPALFDFSNMLTGATQYPENFDSLAWIFENNVDELFPSMPPSPGRYLSMEDAAPTLADLDGQQHRDFAYENDHAAGRDTQINDLPKPTPRDHCSPDDVWPMEWHAASGQPLTLPILATVGEELDANPGSFYNIKNITDTERARMVNSIRLPLERPPWQTVSLANFPSKEKLDHCIDLFFRHLDRVRF